MREKTFLFGETKSLLAVTTEPPPGADETEKTAIILPNAGLIHRTGPNRLYVTIARRLAAAGFPVLRFDLSGIGDSQARKDSVPLEQRAVVEVQEAMNCLEQTRGIGRFVVMGLCSGADDAFRVALVDSRVVGVAMIDPCMYPSAGFYFRSYATRVLKLRSWLTLITGKSDLWGLLKNQLVSRFTKRQTQPGQDWEVIPVEQFRPGLVSLAERGVKLLLVYSDGGAAYYNYRVHVGDELRAADDGATLRMEVIPNSDHIFTRLRHQEALVRVLEEWTRSLGAGAGG